MSAITIQLTGESLDELNNRALAAGVTAEEFLRGYPIVEGMRFGPEVLT